MVEIAQGLRIKCTSVCTLTLLRCPAALSEVSYGDNLMADSLHVASFCCFSFTLSFPLNQEVCTEDGALSKLSDISDLLNQGLTV